MISNSYIVSIVGNVEKSVKTVFIFKLSMDV